MFLRLEDKPPPVYTRESRDFQLFLRLYDCINNMIIDDADSLKNITNTNHIKAELLPLLQTKVGFFSRYEISNDILRPILAAFPYIIQSKGSLQGIRYAVKAYLKAVDYKANIKIHYIQNATSLPDDDIIIPDHTILVGIENTGVKHDTQILSEIFRYILPATYNCMFYFYNKLSETLNFEAQQEAFSFIISQDLNSSIRTVFKDTIPEWDPDKIYTNGMLVFELSENGEKIFYVCDAENSTGNKPSEHSGNIWLPLQYFQSENLGSNYAFLMSQKPLHVAKSETGGGY